MHIDVGRVFNDRCGNADKQLGVVVVATVLVNIAGDIELYIGGRVITLNTELTAVVMYAQRREVDIVNCLKKKVETVCISTLTRQYY